MVKHMTLLFGLVLMVAVALVLDSAEAKERKGKEYKEGKNIKNYKKREATGNKENLKNTDEMAKNQEEKGRKEDRKNQKIIKKQKNKEKQIKQDVEVEIENGGVKPAETVTGKNVEANIEKAKRKSQENQSQLLNENNKDVKEKVKKQKGSNKDEKKEGRYKREALETVMQDSGPQTEEEMIEGCSDDSSEQHKVKETCNLASQPAREDCPTS